MLEEVEICRAETAQTLFWIWAHPVPTDPDGNLSLGFLVCFLRHPTVLWLLDANRTPDFGRMAKGLGVEFAGVGGFSPRNLKYMRSLC